MPTENVLIRLQTIAGLEGIAQMESGLLGLSIPVIGLAAALGAVVIVGKAAIENYKSQEEATNQLKQATDAYNATAGTTITTVKESADAIAAAQDVATKAGNALTFSYSAQAAAQMNYTDAVAKHGVKSEAAIKAGSSLLDANIRMKDAIEANTDAQAKLTAATATTTTEVYHQGINLDDLKKKYDAFVLANAGFISDQYGTETALAAVVRSGKDETEALRILNDALDLSVLKHESIGDAATSIDKVLAGTSKTLKEFGITSEEFNAIWKDKLLTTMEKEDALLQLIERHTAKGRDTLDQTTQSSNKLTIAWQNFTEKHGPEFVGIWQQFNMAAADSLGFIGAAIDKLDELGSWLDAHKPSAGAGLYGGVNLSRSSGTGQTMVPGQGGTVAPVGDIHIHIDQGAYIDGPSTDALANRIAQRLGITTGT